MSIMRAQLPRELYAGGGITEVRQPYFLGKVVRAITKPIKKIAKSPIGKAALLYGLGTLGGSFTAAGTGTGFGRFAPSNLRALGSTMFMRSPENLQKLATKKGVDINKLSMLQKLDPFKTIAATSALPFVMPGTGVEEIDEFSEEVTDRGKFDFDFAEMRSEIANAVSSNDYEQFKTVLNKYNLEEGNQVPFFASLKRGTVAVKEGGRIGYAGGGNVFELLEKELEGTITPEELKLLEKLIKERGKDSLPFAQGGRIGAQEGGIMNLGGMEKDYREEGGFVPIGAKEKADDVPARLSVNEFVFTADAVRSAGDGDVDEGAKVMERVMKNLEAGGKISEESQGMSGAQEMFEVSERLSEVV